MTGKRSLPLDGRLTRQHRGPNQHLAGEHQRDTPESRHICQIACNLRIGNNYRLGAMEIPMTGRKLGDAWPLCIATPCGYLHLRPETCGQA